MWYPECVLPTYCGGLELIMASDQSMGNHDVPDDGDGHIEQSESQLEGRHDASQLGVMLEVLKKLKYSKRELLYLLDVETVSLDRWSRGKPIRTENLKALQRLVKDAEGGISQHPIPACDTCFVPWRYLFGTRAAVARRVYYLSS